MRELVVDRLKHLHQETALISQEVAEVDARIDEFTSIKDDLMAQQAHSRIEASALERLIKQDTAAKGAVTKIVAKKNRPRKKVRRRTTKELLLAILPTECSAGLSKDELAMSVSKKGKKISPHGIYMQLRKLEDKGMVGRVLKDKKDLWFRSENNIVNLKKVAKK